MSQDAIRRAVKKMVTSPAFVQFFTDLVAADFERHLRAEAGGERLYVAKTSCRDDKETRNETIRAKFTGDNYDALARDFHLSVRQIRNICDRKPSEPRRDVS